jgi:DNA-binding NarL/FixJ family response regulator
LLIVVSRSTEGSPRFDWHGHRIGVALIEPLSVIREALGLFIETQPDLELVLAVGTAEDALRALAQHTGARSIVALVSLELTRETAYELIATIDKDFHDVVPIAMASNEERSSVYSAMSAGAHGFIHKRANPAHFLDGLRRIARGDVAMVGVPKEWLPGFIRPPRHRGDTLTSREREVLALARDGFTASQIGRRLAISERTVTTHLANAYRKLGASGRIAAIREAERRGVFAPG